MKQTPVSDEFEKVVTKSSALLKKKIEKTSPKIELFLKKLSIWLDKKLSN